MIMGAGRMAARSGSGTVEVNSSGDYKTKTTKPADATTFLENMKNTRTSVGSSHPLFHRVCHDFSANNRRQDILL